MELNQNMFSSQMNFLGAYAEAYHKRKELAKAIQEKIDKLKPAVQEAENLEARLSEINKTNREDEKFLMNMNNTVEKSLGVAIDNGPLFDEENGNNKERANG